MRRIRDAGLYVAAALAVALALVLTLRLWETDLSVPFDIAGDSLFWMVVVKAIWEDGLWGHVHRLGMPFGSDFADYPMGMPLDFSVLRVLAEMTQSPATAVNLYWLLSLIATGVSATFVLRRLGFDRALAFGLGTLYALLPYGFRSNTWHLPLVYHFIPLVTLLCIRIAEGGIGEQDPRERVLLLLACALQGLSFIYYSFFSCALLLTAGALGWLRTRRREAPRLALVAVGIIIACSAASLAPSLLYWSRHGSNPDVHFKTAAEAEVYALRIRHMLTPVSDHPLGLLKRIATALEGAGFPTERENEAARLGTVASIGFLLLLAYSIAALAGASPPAGPVLRVAAALNLAVLLLALPGGFGTMFSALAAPDIRVYGRLVVFVALFALVAVGTTLALLGDRLAARGKTWRRVWSAAAIVALPLAVLDQAWTADLVGDYGTNAAAFQRDGAFVARVETLLPPGAMVFQLPYTGLPVDRSRPMVIYDHARAYLHSRSLRWSWGGISGRHGDWQREVARLPPPALVRRLSLAGFSGIWIDRLGYRDEAWALEAGIAEAAGSAPVERADGRIAFISLLPYQQTLAASLDPAERARERERALTVPLVPRWREGCQDEEEDESRFWRWCGPQAQLVLRNSLLTERRVLLRGAFKAGLPEGGQLEITSPRFDVRLALTSEETLFEHELVLSPGETVRIEFSFEANRRAATRPLHAFQVVGFTAVAGP